MPRLLYVATRWPWPVTSGRQRMIAQTLELAARTHEVDLAVLSSHDTTDNVPAHVGRRFHIPRPGAFESALDLLVHPTTPLQSHLFVAGSTKRMLSRALAESRPDVVMLDMIRLAGLVETVRAAAPSAHVVIDLDDLLSERYRQMRANGETNLLGAFATGSSPLVRKVAGLVPDLALRIEANLVAKAERALTADAVTLVSPKEAEAFRAWSPGRHVRALPPTTPMHAPAPRDFSRGIRFVFLGNADYAPNAEALRVLDRVAADLRSAPRGSYRPFTFEAAGRGTDRLGLEAVKGLGFVGDVDAFLDASTVMVAPINTGTGIKTKLLDAMSRAVPIVTTERGVEGLRLVDGESVMVVRSGAALALNLLEIIAERRDAAVSAIGLAGAAVAASEHDPDLVADVLSGVLRTANQMV